VSEFQINSFLSSQPDGKTKPAMTVEDVAMGFIRVANEAMCRPIRALTQVLLHLFPAMHLFGVIA
jgi:5-oxoprolinase (ATP-hydrolysing)